ncbi:MAG: carboxypeptidase regulatory-like domain-containing protein [Acidobacteriota bacterium]
MQERLVRLAVLLLITLVISAPAFAQGASSASALSGTVVDISGAIIPGADIAVKNDATGNAYSAVTNDHGLFTIPALDPGTYTVTVKLMGFKTAVIREIKLMAGVPVGIKATLEVGGLEETVVVTGATEVVQTQSAAVSSTMVVEQVSRLPLASRDTLHSVTALPGVMTVAGNSARNSTINGLPSTAINITLDGVNVQDNYNRGTDGFFAYVNPRLDSIEEVTVSTSTPGAESAGQGAVQVRFVTRGGTNRFSGSAFDTYRTWKWATPYWFNQWTTAKEPDGSVFRDRVIVNEPGFRVGGPVYIPKLFDGRDKAFFFFTYEDFRVPSATSRTRVVMTPLAQTGVFTKSDGSTINLLTLAAAAGQTATIDPTMAKLLAQMRSAGDAAPQSKYDTRDPNTQNLSFNADSNQFRKYPAIRLDYNVTKNHRVTFVARYQTFDSTPDLLNTADPAIAGLPYGVGGQSSYRYSGTLSMRSVLTQNMVNEIRYGRSGGTTYFFPEQKDHSMWSGMNGFAIDFGGNIGGNTAAMGLSAPYNQNFYQTRYGPTTQLEDTLNWIKGQHTMSMGFAYSKIGMNNFDWNYPVPQITLGLDSTDPATAFLASALGSGTTAYYQAANMYAVLTGRVQQIADNVYRDGASGNYVYGGLLNQEASQDIYGLFWQDSFKLKPNLTVTAGLRYELQMPFKALNNLYSQVPAYGDVFGVSGSGNLFKPGTLTGTKTSLVQYTSGGGAYKTDKNNAAPSVGIVWRPSISHGFLRALLSEDPVLRGGYSVSYNRFATAVFTGVFGSNPGPSLAGTRSTANANLNQDGLGMPVLLSQSTRLGAPAFPTSPTFPFYGAYGDSPRVFDPNIATPPTYSWSAGFQRQLGKNTAIDIRYVGNKTVGVWTLTNLNTEKAIVENGFMQEFRVAQANLQANIKAGAGNTFAYTGQPGTNPLPILFAYITGQPSGSSTAASYTGSNWTSSTYVTPLAVNNPSPTGLANSLQANLRANAVAAGLATNFMQVNPDYTGALVEKNGGDTRYNGLQIELRRRMASGLLVQGSYVFSRSYTWTQPTLRNGLYGGYNNNILQSGSLGGVDHALKVDWVYELPFGKGKTWGGNVNGWMNAVIGGWEFDGNARFQSGLINTFGNVRLVGMTDKQLQDIYKVYHVWDSAANRDRVYMLPQDFIQNTVYAFSTSATSATGYSGTVPSGAYFAPASGPDCIQAYAGQCAPLNHFVRGPWFGRVDLSVVKKVHLPARMNAEIRLDIINALDTINFIPIGMPGTNTTFSNWQVTSAYRDNNQQQDPGGRLLQLVTRFSW